MSSMPRILPVMTLLASVAGQAQTALNPRRLSSAFQGEVPLLWEVEGRGVLRGARLRLVDAAGQEVWAWQDLAFRDLGKGRWQAWSLEQVGTRFKGLAAGRYALECRMVWEQDGKLRQEETESSLVLEGRGDGWLQKAFRSAPGGSIQWRLPSAWPKGGTLRLEAASLKGLQRVRYQLIHEGEESVLRSWTELPMEGKRAWDLKAEANWPEGPATLWILQEGAGGQAWVEARELWLGQPARGGARPGSGKASAVRTLAGGAQSVAAPAPNADAPTVANAEWLRTVEDPGTPPAWDASNRVATVAFGYWDTERNESNLFPSAAQTQWRPLTFSLAGANGLGKPLYGVSYLLASGANPDTVAEEATRPGFVLPQGAQTLQVGGVPAPVVFSGGTVEDFLGKPLAAGYSFAATAGDATGLPGSGATPEGAPAIMNAWDWSQQASPGSALSTATLPQVGVNAIQAAARFRTHLQAQIKSELGNANPEADLDVNRDPYALAFTSQDPMGRPLLAKGLGSRRPELLDSSFPALKAPMAPVSSVLEDNFDQELNNWYTLGYGTTHAFDPVVTTNGYVQLPPNFTVVLLAGGWIPIYLPGLKYPAGGFTVHVGLAVPGGSPVQVNLKYQGPLRMELFDDTGAAVWSQSLSATSMTAMPTLTIGGSSGVWSPTVPTNLKLRITNIAPTQTIQSGTSLPESSLVRIDDLRVSTTRIYPGLKSPEAALDHPDYPVLWGYTRTQYGTVEQSANPLNGYSVTMVTDGDGSAVAEVKDHEGRTVLKVVNPGTEYTDAFKEYRLASTDGTRKSFRPSAPRTRGVTEGVTPGPQRNLVTQYLFDAEGHLRMVIPPKGLPTNSWGLALTDAQINAVLSAATTDFEGVRTRAQALAPYATFNAYDYAGHLVATYNPDEGLTRFKVDQKGRVHYSQTEKQRKAGTWTRTLYDGIYRVLAVGELAANSAPASDLEGLPTYDPASAAYAAAISTTGASPAMKAGSVSQNTYDDYLGSDPTTAAVLDAKVRAALPSPVLWAPFASGHLTLTQDASTLERYCYDQDGRIVIRWVTLKQADLSEKHFAIGIYYDFAGRVKRLVYPAGPTGEPLQVVYAYDDLGRLYAVGTPQDGAYFARYAYHPTGELRAIVYGPGKGFVAKQMLQDPQGWLRQLKIQGRQG